MSSKPLPTLPRLFNRENEGSSRWTSSFEPSANGSEFGGAPSIDPWKILINRSSQNRDGLRTGLKWLCVFAYSGVDIPIKTFLQLSALSRDLASSFDEQTMLCEAAFISTWIKSLGRSDLQVMISDLHDRNASWILAHIRSQADLRSMYVFTKPSSWFADSTSID